MIQKQIFMAMIASLALLLSSCVALVAAGAAAGMAVYDKRSMSVIEQDARIFYLLHKSIVQDPRLRGTSITVTSFNRVVLLTGQAPLATQKVIAEKKARITANVERVYNEINIAPPLSYSERSKDAWITSQIKAQMLQKRGLKSGSFKVITEDGTVYLMGVVTHQQANLAVDVARRVSGVKKVVKVFIYC